jgi:hypothetical protein
VKYQLSSCKRSEADLRVAVVEDSVDVAHEHITNDPEVGGAITYNATDAARGSFRRLTEVERIGGHRELLATEREGDTGWSTRAGEGVETGTEGAARILSPRDRSVEFGDVGEVPDDQSCAGIDDGAGGADSPSRTHGHCVEVDLPVALFRHGDVGHAAGVEVAVQTTNGELGARVGKLECKNRAGGLATLDECLENRRGVVVGNRLETHSQETCKQRQ